ncbi:MAG: hypothetical protein JSS27_19390 [Planctomycetes bacterium]|nr:hypothetical protein [Planctomycetota bacterium]
MYRNANRQDHQQPSVSERTNGSQLSPGAKAFVDAILGRTDSVERRRAEEEAHAQELREWVASITTTEGTWDPAKHPRGGYPQNRGWWSPGGGSNFGSRGSHDDSSPGRNVQGRPKGGISVTTVQHTKTKEETNHALGEREWKAAAGNFASRGKFVEFVPGGKVKLRLNNPNGTTRDVELDPAQLSADDQELIRGLKALPDNVRLDPAAPQVWKEKVLRDVAKLNELAHGAEILNGVGETAKPSKSFIGGKWHEFLPVNNAPVTIVPATPSQDNRTRFTPQGSEGKASDVTVHYNPDNFQGDLVVGGGDRTRPPFIALGKELTTATRALRGRTGAADASGLSLPEESKSRRSENQLRDQYNRKYKKNLPQARVP